MNTGALATFAAFGAAGAGLAAYIAAWSGNRPAVRLARIFFSVMTACLAFASILLMGAILSDDFSIVYVTNYSARALPALYKISAFWAGQEGTILLWGLFQGIIGLFVIKRKDEWESPVMSFLLVPQTLLLLLLVKVQPFRTAPPPMDGQGLNPLLQDPWMAIHPPIVFLGYAALVAPFAFALAALAMKRTDSWVPAVVPWVLVSVTTLGIGLFIGGYWAYKVLGWGGYWGWDPVENSSLAPWLAVSALIHGLLTQRAKGSLVRTNLVLGTLAYVLALYSTYLTRSGVLANFSVHSFADGGLNTYLIVMLVVTTGLSAVMLAARWRSIKAPALDWSLSLGTFMALGILFLMLGTALLVIGTSWPIVSTLAGSPASPGPGFYNRVSLPIGLGIIALLTAAPLMGWGPAFKNRLLRQVAPGVTIGLLAAALPLAFGLRPKGGLVVLLLLAGAVAALTACLIRLGRQIRTNPLGTGAAISHAGLALMFVGIVTTSAFDRMESTTLVMGEPREIMGHRMTLKGYVPDEPGMEPHFEIETVSSKGKGFTATPIMFRYAGGTKIMARPYIERSLLGDLYIAPVSYRPEEPSAQRITLVKNRAMEWGDLELTFRQFQSHATDGTAMRVGALVDVARGEETDQVTLVLTAGPEGPVSDWVDLPFAEGVAAKLDGMQVEAGAIHVTLRRPTESTQLATLAVDVSNKPLVNALWIGMVLVGAGAGLAAYHRKIESDALVALASASPRNGKAKKKPTEAVPAGMIPVARPAARR